MIRLVIFFMVSLMMTGTSQAEEASPCSVDTVPIQIITETKHLDVTTLSAAKIRDYPRGFAAFVTAVTEHLAAKLGQEKLCLYSAESQEQSLLQFVPRYVTISDSRPEPSVPHLKARPTGICRISSPWIDLAIERKPVPRVRGIVRWSERQLLADQAVLAGARNVPSGAAKPIKGKEYREYIDEYMDYMGSELRGEPALKPIEERVPPDLLWLFRRSLRSPHLYGDETDIVIRNAMKAGAENYTKIVIALIDQCLASDGADIQYNSVLDVSDLISLEQYKIITPLD